MDRNWAQRSTQTLINGCVILQGSESRQHDVWHTSLLGRSHATLIVHVCRIKYDSWRWQNSNWKKLVLSCTQLSFQLVARTLHVWSILKKRVPFATFQGVKWRQHLVRIWRRNPKSSELQLCPPHNLDGVRWLSASQFRGCWRSARILEKLFHFFHLFRQLDGRGNQEIIETIWAASQAKNISEPMVLQVCICFV